MRMNVSTTALTSGFDKPVVSQISLMISAFVIVLIANIVILIKFRCAKIQSFIEKRKTSTIFLSNNPTSICLLGFYYVFLPQNSIFMYTKLRYIALSLLLISLLPGFASTVWTADNLPIPYLKDRTRHVADPDGVLRKAELDSANYYLGKLECDKQVQSLFVVVRRVKDGDVFRMAQDLGNKLGVGDKNTRRGLVVVIALEDRKYFVAPGMGLEGELTDVDCDDIARACIVTNMRKDLPGQAVVSTSRAIYNKVSTGKTGVSSIDNLVSGEEDDLALTVVMLLIIFAVPIYLLVRLVLVRLGIVKPKPLKPGSKRNHHDDDWFPPFIFGGGGGLGHGGGGGFSGGSFGGGSFGGGGSGGSW